MIDEKYWKKICELHKIPFNKYNFEDNITKCNLDSIKIDNKYLIGGSKEVYLYNNNKILFFKTKEDDKITYSIKSMNNDELNECLLIEIEFNVKLYTTKLNTNVAYISIIMNDGKNRVFSSKSQELGFCGKCKYYKSDNKMTGTDLIDIAIDFIKSKKEQYKLTTIYLTDNSKKLCYGIPSKNMSLIYALLNGHTWYGKRGFRPFDISKPNDSINHILLQYYNNNLELNKLVKVKHIKDFDIIIKNAYIKNKDKIILGNKVISDIKENVLLNLINNNSLNDKYKNSNLGEFLKFLLDNNVINCYIFFDFIDELLENINIDIKYNKSIIENMSYYDFYRKSFYLDI